MREVCRVLQSHSESVVFQDDYGDPSATTLVEAPWAIVKWNPCGGESPQYK